MKRKRRFYDGIDESLLPLKKRKKKYSDFLPGLRCQWSAQLPPSLLPQHAIAGPVRVFQKEITKSDRDKKQHRLLLSKALPALEGMMTPAEKIELTNGAGLRTRTLDRLGRTYALTLKRLGSAGYYRIMGDDYGRLVADNKFRRGQHLDLWAFRVGRDHTGSASPGELQMVVVNHEKARKEQVQAHGDGEEFKTEESTFSSA
ncbi:hypothetical protein GW17_00002756 [Ensete ventricosum]|nr:hypothetical protein GW17_00002756 [Ensete ventricosum]